MFYKSIETSNVSQTSENVAAEIVKVMTELDLSGKKIVSVITDNCAANRGARDIIERLFPKFLLLLNESAIVVKFITNHVMLNSKFRELQGAFNQTRGLLLPVSNRWCSHYNSIVRLIKNKRPIINLLEEKEILNSIQPKESVEQFKDLVKDDDFWGGLNEMERVLKGLSLRLKQLESDDADLSFLSS